MNNDKKTPQEELLEEVKKEEAAGGKPQEEKGKASQAPEASPENAKAEDAKAKDASQPENPEEKKAGKKKKIKMPSSLKKTLKSRRFQRGGIATAFTAVFIVVVILVNVVVSLLSDRFPSMNIDLTANQVNTLSEEALDVAKDVQYETNIYIIASDGWIDYAESYGYPYSTLISITDRLVEANSKIHVETIDLETNPTFANEYADESLTNGCVVVETEKRYRVLTTNDLFPQEQNSQTGSTALYNDVNSAVASALQQVNLEKVPLISIATGHSEMLQSTDLELLTSFFNDYAFDVQQFDILTEDIPEDTRILYIPTPGTDYTESELEKLDTYLSEDPNGDSRSILFTANPGQATLPNLQAFLEEWGISYDSSSIVMESDTSRTMGGTPYAFIADVDNSESMIPSGDTYSLLLTPMSVPVEGLFNDSSVNGVGTYTLFSSSESSYLAKAEDLNTEDADSGNGEQASYELGVMARKSLASDGLGASANVVVLGSTYMISPAYTSTNTFSNGDYFADLLRYMTDTTDSNNTVYSPSVEVGTADMTATTSVINVLGLGVFTIAIPVVVLLVGLVIYFKRRHL